MIDAQAWALADRQEAVELVRVLDDEVEAYIRAARARRRILVRRVARCERLAAELAGKPPRESRDAPPWWATGRATE